MTFTLLDVAIGMTFMYLLLSLICSAINELIAALLKSRARFLEQGISRLLEDPQLKNQLYCHPLIRNLYNDVHPILRKLRVADLPAYIPARNFALAMMDLVQPGAGTRGALTPSPAPIPNAPPLQPTAEGWLHALEQNAAAVPASVQRAMISLAQAAGADAARTRQNIEDWYNSTMDRVSGAYKRRTQYAIFVIGLLVTIAVNADSVVVFKRLNTDKALASAVAESASQYAKTASPAGASGHVSSSAPPPGEDVQQAKKDLTDKLNTLDRLGLPIGWTGEDEKDTPPAWPGWDRLPDYWPASGKLLALHWTGWLLTAFAVSFGAPFWFDLLNQFMVVRSTVKPQEKSAVEGPKN